MKRLIDGLVDRPWPDVLQTLRLDAVRAGVVWCDKLGVLGSVSSSLDPFIARGRVPDLIEIAGHDAAV